MSRIMISYRRADSAAVAGRLFDRLANRFGRGSVFMDIDAMPLAVDFRDYVDGIVRSCDAVVAVIGPDWVGPDPGGKQRIFNDDDPVRLEIQAALAHGIPLIPVMINGAKLPARGQMPDELLALSQTSGVELSIGRDFDAHVRHLSDELHRILRKRPVRTHDPSVVSLFGRYVAPQVVILAALHYVLVMKLDVDATYVRAVMMAVSFLGGLALDRVATGPAVALSGTAALLSALAMLTVVGLIDDVPILPRALVAWQESLETVMAVLLPALAGRLLARLFRRAVLRQPVS